VKENLIKFGINNSLSHCLCFLISNIGILWKSNKTFSDYLHIYTPSELNNKNVRCSYRMKLSSVQSHFLQIIYSPLWVIMLPIRVQVILQYASKENVTDAEQDKTPKYLCTHKWCVLPCCLHVECTIYAFGVLALFGICWIFFPILLCSTTHMYVFALIQPGLSWLAVDEKYVMSMLLWCYFIIHVNDLPNNVDW
jgi:hypothetical protein